MDTTMTDAVSDAVRLAFLAVGFTLAMLAAKVALIDGLVRGDGRRGWPAVTFFLLLAVPLTLLLVGFEEDDILPTGASAVFVLALLTGVMTVREHFIVRTPAQRARAAERAERRAAEVEEKRITEDAIREEDRKLQAEEREAARALEDAVHPDEDHGDTRDRQDAIRDHIEHVLQDDERETARDVEDKTL